MKSVDNFAVIEFIKKYYKLNRAPVCDDIVYFTEKIKEILPQGNILRSKSGEECLTWVTPQAWNVKYGVLKDSSGKTIVDFKDNPMHLMQYSSSFTGQIDFTELNKHLYYSKEHPDDIPFINRKQYEYRLDDSWGMALPYNIYKNLDHNETFFVDIKVEFSNKEMAIYDLYIPGAQKATIFFAAHSCHPGQVNDGIANVALLIQLFKWIISLDDRRYSYRLIVGPEYFAAPFFLKKDDMVQNIRYGFFLDMMVHSGPMGFSSSYQGDTLVDFVTEQCFKKQFKKYQRYKYRGLWGNGDVCSVL